MDKCKKLICIGLVISMLNGILVGCNEPTEILNDSTDTLTSTATNQEDRVKITYWDAFCDNMLADSYTEQLIESALPVDIVVNRSDYLNMVQVMRLLEEDNFPDVVWYRGESTYIKEKDLARTIPYDMVAEHAPSFLELYETNPTIFTTIVNPDNHDEFIALTGTTDQASRVAGSQYADYYRYDWIENLGIDLGVEVTQLTDNIYVADTGLTLEKFEEVMHAFTFDDPDGNGIDDTYGASFDEMQRFDLLYSAFGIINGVNEFNGQAEMHYATDSFKDFAIWFSDLYSKDYIDKDFLNQLREQRWSNVENNEYGYFLESSIAVNTWASDRPPLSMFEENPDIKFLITPGLSDENGHGTMVKNAMPTQGYLCYINKNVDDEKLAIILQTLEYMNFGDEKVSMWFGEEGVDWQYDENGKVQEINVLKRAEKGNVIFTQNVQTGVLFDAITMQPIFEAGSDFWLDDCIWRENDREQYPYKLDLLKETNYENLTVEYGSTINGIVFKYFEDWVYNGLDVESSWNDYLQELDDAGYNLMMDELDKVEPLETMILEFIK